ncbi:immunoglobulin domain-containing protein [Actomonas aquatica]|uniref:Immunoglobulin domain-containing protein n=1 Tax=Actomonas aquatica TaxID=2866162 RepID=A0ABZ1C6P3_9BACT|nr:immunoglobulin domain-containing protein [Opitutus sp. WL0086]WRQ86199.1 immunoglobulin domain-containing protein [Opitutus sp. WL0086]
MSVLPPRFSLNHLRAIRSTWVILFATTAAFVLGAPPMILVHPASTQLVGGADIGISVDVRSDLSFTYQWRRNGVPVSGATNNSLFFSATDPSRAGDYDVVVSNADGSVTSRTARVSIPTTTNPPVITSVGPDRRVDVGSSVAVAIGATGHPFTSVQWFKNNSALSGQTQTYISFDSATAANSGTYHAVVTNAFGSATSASITLTVGAGSGGDTPQFTAGPAHLTTVKAGESLFLSVQVTSNSTATYQWFKDAVALTGATGSSLSIDQATAATAGDYHVVVTNAAGSATSSTATVVIQPPEPPVLRYHPSSKVVARYDSTLPLTVSAVGTAPLRYQWYRDGVALPGATSFQLFLETLDSPEGSFTVVVTNDVGSAESDPAVIEVVDALSGPTFVTQPQDVTVNPGEPFALIGEAIGSDVRYTWWKNGQEWRGLSTPDFTVQSASPYHAGTYVLVATDYTGSRPSRTATVTVLAGEAPVITQQPEGLSASFGDTVTFSVAATGVPAPTYQWNHNGGPIEGETGTTLTLNNVQAADDGTYWVTVTNGVGSVNSRIVELDLPVTFPVFTKPTISMATTTVAVPPGGELVLAAHVTGWPDPDLWWTKDGTIIPNQNQPTLRLPGFAARDAGFYMLSARNGRGLTRGPAVTVSVGSSINDTTYRTPATAANFGALDFDTLGRATLLLHVPATGLVAFAQNLTLANNDTTEIDLAQTSTEAVPGAYRGKLLIGLTPTGATITLPDESVVLETTPVAPDAFTPSALIGHHSLAPMRSLLPSSHLFVFGDGNVEALVLSGATQTRLQGTITPNGSFQLTANGQTLAGSLHDNSLTATLTGGTFGALFATPAAANGPERLINLSTRTRLGANQQIIVGFVVGGQGGLATMLRAVGPTLSNYQIAGYLPDPRLQLYANGYPFLENNNWSQGSDANGLNLTASQVGAFPLDENSTDAALLYQAYAGPVTMHVSDASGEPGVTLIEIYDRQAPVGYAARLTNLSARGQVSGSGEGAVVLGFVVSGPQPKRLLIRGIGPTLGTFNVANPLPDPVLRLFEGEQVLLQNSRWTDAPNASQLPGVSAQVGAFALAEDSNDACLLVHLPPGVYTAQITSAQQQSGEAMVEVYEAPAVDN